MKVSRINSRITMLELGSRDEWLQARGKRIGGSEASAVVGLNPYMSNTDLWSIKTGRREAEDISDKPYVRYGHDAEPLLRELFKLDFPDYKVGYVDNNRIRKAGQGSSRSRPLRSCRACRRRSGRTGSRTTTTCRSFTT